MSRILNLSKTSSPKLWGAIRRYAGAKRMNELVGLALAEGAPLNKIALNPDGTRMKKDDKMLYNAMLYFGNKHNEELLDEREVRKQLYAKKLSEQRKQATRERKSLKRNPIEHALVTRVQPIIANRYYDLPNELQALIKSYIPKHIFYTHLLRQSTATNHQLYDFLAREVNYAQHAIKCIGKLDNNKLLWTARINKYNKLENYADHRYASQFSGHPEFITPITMEFMIRNFDLCMKLTKISQLIRINGFDQLRSYNRARETGSHIYYNKPPGETFAEFKSDYGYHTWYNENNFHPDWKQNYTPTHTIVMNKRFTKFKRVLIPKKYKCLLL